MPLLPEAERVGARLVYHLRQLLAWIEGMQLQETALSNVIVRQYLQTPVRPTWCRHEIGMKSESGFTAMKRIISRTSAGIFEARGSAGKPNGD